MFKKITSYFLLILWAFVPSTFFAQDLQKGEDLFKANCTSCHRLGDEKKARLIGPGLNAKIFEEFSEDWLINWIRNSSAVIESGDDQAIALFEEYNQSVMTSFSNFSDEDIKNILGYIKNPPLEEKEEIIVDANKILEEPQDSQSLILIIVGLVALFLFSSFVKNSLKKASNIEETFYQGFKKWITNNVVIVVIVIVISMGYFLVLGWQSLSKIGIRQNYKPTQPIEFSHKIHAGINGIDCNYCHSSARKSKHAGIPSANVCMNCHANIVEGTNTGIEEIGKIYTAIGYDPDTRSYIDNYEKQPIKWVRVHDLPDLVYFNHSQHVVAGKIECQECHGPIEEMDVVYQQEKLTMKWCIDCHKKTKIDLDNPYYHEYDNWIEKHNKTNLTVENIGGLECGKCHY